MTYIALLNEYIIRADVLMLPFESSMGKVAHFDISSHYMHHSIII